MEEIEYLYESEVSSINSSCRICLENCINLNSFYDLVEYGRKIELIEVFRVVGNVEAKNEKIEKPTNICHNCTSELLSAYELYLKIQHSETVLNNQGLEISTKEFGDPEKIPDIYQISVEVEDNVDEYTDLIYTKQDEVSTKEENDDVDNKEAELEKEDDNRNKGDDKRYQRIEKDETYLCEICEERFTNLLERDAHYKEHSCKKTEEVSTKLDVVNFENNSNCDENSIELTIVTTDNTFLCNVCGKGFGSNDNLSRHMRTHSKKSKFECSICHRNYSRKDNLTRHEEIHKRDRQPAEQRLCPFCGKYFSAASLLIHMRRHTGEKPYKCDMCDKAFPRSQELHIHKRCHTGERPHICSECGKAFARANKLARHKRVHTGEKPYKCSFCDKAFTQSNDLTLHTRRHTGDKPYLCGQCDTRFISGTDLKKHRSLTGHIDDLEVPDRFASIRVDNLNRTDFWKKDDILEVVDDE